mmetsp:Transcript_43887/g.107727  ORF Transcript_43887/g.107727 Transcript_43887/m.107727 type:complete len:200 (+) Transcript_43887:436-1035(+)
MSALREYESVVVVFLSTHRMVMLSSVTITWRRSSSLATARASSLSASIRGAAPLSHAAHAAIGTKYSCNTNVWSMLNCGEYILASGSALSYIRMLRSAVSDQSTAWPVKRSMAKRSSLALGSSHLYRMRFCMLILRGSKSSADTVLCAAARRYTNSVISRMFVKSTRASFTSTSSRFSTPSYTGVNSSIVQRMTSSVSW